METTNGDGVPEVFPLGEHLMEEQQARGWSAADLAARTGISPERLVAIFAGAVMLMAEAEAFGRAFGVSPELFLNLQQRYRASRNVP